MQRLVLDLDNVGGLDLAAVDMLASVGAAAKQNGYEFELVGATADVRNTLRKDGLGDLLSEPKGSTTVEDAVLPS